LIGVNPADPRATTVGSGMEFLLRLGRVPRVGDAFTWESYRVEVVDMDGNRVDKVLVTRLPAVKQ
jgi:CBS domain containing-hemolysin-like protein